MTDAENDAPVEANVVENAAHASAVFIPLRQALIRTAIHALNLPLGSHGIDVGCGTGHPATLLAKAVGSAGQVTGLDLSPEILLYAQSFVEKCQMADQITFKQGDAAELPFDDNTFDWAWSMDCVGYLPLNQLPMLREMARVVRPAGSVAILAWSSEKLLPGFPTLEARLSATSPGVAPFARGMKPESHFLRALGWFHQAGLVEPTAQTFVSSACAPLTGDLRQALEALFQMRWPGVEAELSQEDWADFQRLCLPESNKYILKQPDYYAFFTYSMFRGIVVE